MEPDKSTIIDENMRTFENTCDNAANEMDSERPTLKHIKSQNDLLSELQQQEVRAEIMPTDAELEMRKRAASVGTKAWAS
jgi:hypothetical protein